MRFRILLCLLSLVGYSALAQHSTSAQAQAGTDGATSAAATDVEAPLEFRTVVGDKPIEIPADQVTPAFEEFRRTGANPFTGDEVALAEGKKLYAKLCQACHLPDGSGRIGPSLRDDQWRHEGLDTEAGRFEIIHSGGAGAMQAFHHRIGIDEILKVMVWTDTFGDN